MFIIFFILIGASAFAQTGHFSGQATLTRNSGSSSKMEYFAVVTLGKNSRTWEMTKCEAADKNDCHNFKSSLVQEINGKWNWVEPGIKAGTVLKTPAKVEEDHIKLHTFRVGGINDFGKPWSLVYQAVGEGFMLKEISSDKSGPLDLKIIFTPITEKIYRETLGKRKIKTN